MRITWAADQFFFLFSIIDYQMNNKIFFNDKTCTPSLPPHLMYTDFSLGILRGKSQQSQVQTPCFYHSKHGINEPSFTIIQSYSARTHRSVWGMALPRTMRRLVLMLANKSPPVTNNGQRHLFLSSNTVVIGFCCFVRP